MADNIFANTNLPSKQNNGKLIILDNGDNLKNDATVNRYEYNVIEFPAMPDSIELSRETDYVATPNYVMPDGVHMYKSTSILTIPFSFKLHAFDSAYCPNGPATLLLLGARLHALTLPISATDVQQTVTGSSPVNNEASKNTGATSGDSTGPSASLVNQGIDPPVTVRLELSNAGATMPGISCNGYIKDVKFAQFGPWLAGPNGEFNLPSAAEYSFTFVFHPSHGNAYSGNTNQARQEVDALATYVRQYLYNQNQMGTPDSSSWRSY